MRIRLLPALLPLLLLVTTSPLPAADEAPRTLRVQGDASVTAAPDLARLVLGVQHRDPSMATARDRVVRVSRDFLALAKKLGIPEGKVSSSGLNIRPDYRWDQETGQQVFTGYFVQRQLTVELAELERLGELIEGALDAGVNEVSSPQLDSSQRRELQRQALARAGEDARRTAEQLAAAMGLTLGPVLAVEAGDVSAPGPMPRMGAVRAMADMEAAESYVAGEIRLDGRVGVVFQLLP